MNMDVVVKYSGTQRTRTLPQGSNAFLLLKEIGLFPDAVLIFRNGTVLPEDEIILDGDCIEVMRISSGG